MNDDKLIGEGRDIAGKVKETVGDVTGDSSFKAEGLGDQLSGKFQKVVGAARDALNVDAQPLADKARTFAKERPLAAAALVGVIALAVFNTLRGKR